MTEERNQMATFVERVDGSTDRWSDATPIVQFDDGILRLERGGDVLAYYAAGQWRVVYQETETPLRIP